MRRLFDIVKKNVHRPFDSWKDFLEYLTFLSVCVAGVFNASWLWPLVGAMVLLLLGWQRYSELLVKAAEVDAEYLAGISWLLVRQASKDGFCLEANVVGRRPHSADSVAWGVARA